MARSAHVLLLLLPLVVVHGQQRSTVFLDGMRRVADCNDRLCWFMPPNCEKDNVHDCYAIVKTSRPSPSTLRVQLASRTTDLSTPSSYIALGLSTDVYMGDDLVVECVLGGGGVSAFLSWNDGTHNTRLYNASATMLTRELAAAEDGFVMCNLTIDYGRSGRVDEEEKPYVERHDLSAGNAFYLQMARGPADPITHALHIHSTSDDGFPWTTALRVDLGTQGTWEGGMERTFIVNRFWKYRMAGVHGILMVIAWWLLALLSIVFARHFKSVYKKQKIFGEPVWFQMHRVLAITSVVLQCIAFILVFVQSGRFLTCDGGCDAGQYNTWLHALLGTIATGLAIIQPFLAWARPKPISPLRRSFNWLHWGVGMGSYTCATVTIFLSINLGKTGLRRNFGHIPDYVSGGYIALVIGSMLAMEWMTSGRHGKNQTKAASEMKMQVLSGPRKVDAFDRRDTNNAHSLLLFLLILGCVLVCAAFTYFIVFNWH